MSSELQSGRMRTVSSLLDTNKLLASKKLRTELKSNYRTTANSIFTAKNFCFSTRGKLSFYAILEKVNCNAMQFAKSKINLAMIVRGALAAASALTVVTSVLVGGAAESRAAQPRLQDLSVGTMINIGGQTYLKLSSNTLILAGNYTCPDKSTIAGQKVKCFTCPEGSSYDANINSCTCNTAGYKYDYVTNSCSKTCESGRLWSDVANACIAPTIYGCANPIGTMQNWNGCSGAATPTYGTTAYSLDVCLMDERDGKTYQVRKFADGKCWMVTNLAYGGNTADGVSTDGCWGINDSFRGAQTLNADDVPYESWGHSYTDRFGADTYGNCRASWETTGDTVNMSQDVHMYGYSYDWAAAVQDPMAYWSQSSIARMAYTAGGNDDNTGTNYAAGDKRQGICPTDWYLPRGGVSGDFQTLYVATGANDVGFCQGTWSGPASGDGSYTGGNWRGVYSGWAGGNSGEMVNYGDEGVGYWWTSTWRSNYDAYYLRMMNTGINRNAADTKRSGFAVRCLRD